MIRLDPTEVGWAGFHATSLTSAQALVGKDVPRLFRLNVEGIDHTFTFLDTVEDRVTQTTVGWVYRSTEGKLTVTLWDE